MDLGTSEENLSPQFRSLFERKSRELFEAKKRAANLKGPLASALFKAIAKFLGRMIEVRLEVDAKEDANTRREPNFWQRRLRSAIAYLGLKQLVVVVLQYRFDILSFELKRGKAALDLAARKAPLAQMFTSAISGEFNHTNWHQFSVNKSSHMIQIERKIAQYERMLKFVGAPFIRLSALSECAMFYMIFCLLIYYLAPLILCKLRGTLDVNILRVFLDENRELQNLNKLILDECEKIIDESKYYFAAESAKYRSAKNGSHKMAIALLSNRKEFLFRRESLDEQNRTLELLKKLALKGKLHPANRMPKYIAILAKLVLIAWLLCVITYLFSVVTAPMVMGSLLDFQVQFNFPMDVIAIFEVEFIAIVSVQLLQFWAGLHVLVFGDQMYTVLKLKKMLKQCIEASCLFHELQMTHDYYPRRTYIGSLPSTGLQYDLLASKRMNERRHRSELAEVEIMRENFQRGLILGEENASRIERMNENLLRMLANYRIFVRQFKPLKEFFSQLTFYIQAIHIIYPVILTIHVPYMSRRDCILVIAFLWINTIVHDFAFLSICAYHAQCSHLQKLMFALLARIDQLQDLSLRDSLIYDPFIVSLLRRELDHLDLAALRISIITFGSPMSYIFILRVYFWMGILSVYALFAYETKTGRYADGMADSSIFGFLI